MSAGYRTSDLSRILHDPAHTVARCEACRFRSPWATKSATLRAARRHVASTCHTVTIDIYHWQRVHPQEVNS